MLSVTHGAADEHTVVHTPHYARGIRGLSCLYLPGMPVGEHYLPAREDYREARLRVGEQRPSRQVAAVSDEKLLSTGRSSLFSQGDCNPGHRMSVCVGVCRGVMSTLTSTDTYNLVTASVQTCLCPPHPFGSLSPWCSVRLKIEGNFLSTLLMEDWQDRSW